MLVQAIARLWRVAHFVLSDFLNLSLEQASSNKLNGTHEAGALSQVSDLELLCLR